MKINVFNEQDFIFLPCNSFNASCSDSALIYYYNADADGGKGCFEKGRLWKDNILQLNKEVKGNPSEFFGHLWETLNVTDSWGVYSDNEEFYEIIENYENADYIFVRDGNICDELVFLLNWANC